MDDLNAPHGDAMEHGTRGGGEPATQALPAYPSIRQSLVLCLLIIIFMVACSPVIMIEGLGPELGMLIYYVLAFGISFYVADSLRRRKSGLSHYEFRVGSPAVVLALALGSVALLIGVVAPLGALIPISDAMTEGMEELVAMKGPAFFLTFVVAAPVLEELICRGIILDGFLRRYGAVPSILISSFLFGAIHLNPVQFVTGLVVGSYLGWVYWRTRSVGACIVIHMAANFSGYIARFIMDEESIMPAEQTNMLDNYGGLWQFVVVTGGCVLLFMACVGFQRKALPRPSW